MEKSLLLENLGKEGTESNKRVARVKTECNLPHDLLIEILSRIPVASLIRFKCVSKLWCSLTKDHRLINSHLERASRTNPPRIIIFSPLLLDGKHIFHDLILIDSSWNIKYELRRIIFGSIQSRPPCNGLMCFFGGGEIEILNPTTQEFLLPPKHNSKRFTPDPRAKYCLGFHPLMKKYKVVRISLIKVGRTMTDYVLGCEVYELGSSHLWREIGVIDCFLTSPGINVNGSIYWTTSYTMDNIPDEIVALDLESEKFRYISLPNLEANKIVVEERMLLVELEKNVCLVNANSFRRTMDIWMLEGNDNTWVCTCRFSIEIGVLKCQFRSEPMYIYEGGRYVSIRKHEEGARLRFAPIYIYDGKVLFRYGETLYCHDLGNRRTVKVFSECRVGRDSEIYAFVETLVPLIQFDFEAGK